MPDARLQRARATLPEGYQFPTPTHVHSVDGFDAVRLVGLCQCGAKCDLYLHPTPKPKDWNFTIPASWS